jgi:hypothetical protein
MLHSPFLQLELIASLVVKITFFFVVVFIVIVPVEVEVVFAFWLTLLGGLFG